jgi:SNF2 family DNA or RNA helicase
MIEFDFNRCLVTPSGEQIDGIKHLVIGTRLSTGEVRPYTALFDRPGFGKTKQIIDAACVLYENSLIDTVVVIAPKSVCSTWDEDDPEFGEIAKHSWIEYTTKRYKKEETELPTNNNLQWLVMSYGFLRKKVGHQFPVAVGLIKKLKNRKFWLVIDESSFIKSKDANQFKAVKKLREAATRVTLLNGTPVSQGVVDLWSQFMVLDPKIIENDRDGEPMTFPEFRSKFCITELKSLPNRRPFYVIHSDNKVEVDKLRQKAKPWIMRRKVSGLPPKIYSHIEATLSPVEWKAYCDMRDTMVAWLRDCPSEAANGAVRMMRLAQITSGHLGGLSEVMGVLEENVNAEQEIGDSKQKAFFEWLDTIPSEEQIIVWCRFRRELDRLQASLLERNISCGIIYGGQSDSQRDTSKGGFQRGLLRILGCQPQAGGFGLNLQNAHISVYQSTDYNYLTRDQSEERIHRRGQLFEQHIIDIIAKGPNGQKTIDSEVIKALRHKDEVANWTAEAWLKALDE